MDFLWLSSLPLFSGMKEEELEGCLPCFTPQRRSYDKGEVIFSQGDVTKKLGIVIKGKVHMEAGDFWGNQSLIGYAGVGEIFAETYACLYPEPMMIRVVAEAAAEVLFLDALKMTELCNESCNCHGRLLKNLQMLTAKKNLGLSKRILHSGAKTIRGRLLSYLSEQSLLANSSRFSVGLKRQQLADYLGVDRSALCSELSKMQKDGLILYEKNQFELLKEW